MGLFIKFTTISGLLFIFSAAPSQALVSHEAAQTLKANYEAASAPATLEDFSSQELANQRSCLIADYENDDLLFFYSFYAAKFGAVNNGPLFPAPQFHYLMLANQNSEINHYFIIAEGQITSTATDFELTFRYPEQAPRKISKISFRKNNTNNTIAFFVESIKHNENGSFVVGEYGYCFFK